jgi:hypothetical protein
MPVYKFDRTITQEHLNLIKENKGINSYHLQIVRKADNLMTLVHELVENSTASAINVMATRYAICLDIDGLDGLKACMFNELQAQGIDHTEELFDRLATV